MNGRRILFHRDFTGYTGGHGKVWDYFKHALALGMDARVYLTPRSLRDASNPWSAVPQRVEAQWRPGDADLLFLAGMDWQALPADIAAPPVINLVQHVRHADPDHPLRRFLSRSAWRICVSQAVTEAIAATGEVRGSISLIPAALDLAAAPVPPATRRGVFVGALKNPELGHAVAGELRSAGCEVRLVTEWMPRAEYLAALAQAAVALPLPHATEGFFLPGLEAMALGCAVVMPDCKGSAEYAVAEGNCLMPPALAGALAAAVKRLCGDAGLRRRLTEAGARTALSFDPAEERSAFAALLRQVAA